MDQCFYCHWYRKQHDQNCPEVAEAASKAEARAIWQQGYNDGRRRRDSQSTNPTYMIGWVRGDAAADYAENVFE